MTTKGPKGTRHHKETGKGRPRVLASTAEDTTADQAINHPFHAGATPTKLAQRGSSRDWGARRSTKQKASAYHDRIKTLKIIDAVERTVKNTMRKLAKCIRLIQ